MVRILTPAEARAESAYRCAKDGRTIWRKVYRAIKAEADYNMREYMFAMLGYAWFKSLQATEG